MDDKTYIAIDLKSFYASVECVERGLDPLTANLVVADPSRTEKTICLAVSPALKAYGIPGRARLFEVVEKTKGKNVDYVVAPPRMALYMDYSTRIYNIYLKYVAPEDISVYSVDEVFIDATAYLSTYNMTGEELAMTMIRDVLKETGITATSGIGTNLYLCKIAMDIVAKHMPPNEDGVRIASLNEKSYREILWNHRPLTDFWRIGNGYVKKLEKAGLYTMGDIARCSLGEPNDYYNEDLLYKMFGVNAELLIDHAWGWEPVTMADIRAYRPKDNSLSSGQVLKTPYAYEDARIVLTEMADKLSLMLVDKGLSTDQVTLTIGYDIENLTDENRRKKYKGPVKKDHYGRLVPKHAHGTKALSFYTSSTKLITKAFLDIYENKVDKNLLIRRLTVVANHVLNRKDAEDQSVPKQLDFFSDFELLKKKEKENEANLIREKKLQEAELQIKKKFGKNAILRGTNFLEKATMRERNEQIGGHKA